MSSAVSLTLGRSQNRVLCYGLRVVPSVLFPNSSLLGLFRLDSVNSVTKFYLPNNYILTNSE